MILKKKTFRYIKEHIINFGCIRNILTTNFSSNEHIPRRLRAAPVVVVAVVLPSCVLHGETTHVLDAKDGVGDVLTCWRSMINTLYICIYLKTINNLIWTVLKYLKTRKYSWYTGSTWSGLCVHNDKGKELGQTWSILNNTGHGLSKQIGNLE